MLEDDEEAEDEEPSDDEEEVSDEEEEVTLLNEVKAIEQRMPTGKKPAFAKINNKAGPVRKVAVKKGSASTAVVAKASTSAKTVAGGTQKVNYPTQVKTI